MRRRGAAWAESLLCQPRCSPPPESAKKSHKWGAGVRKLLRLAPKDQLCASLPSAKLRDLTFDDPPEISHGKSTHTTETDEQAKELFNIYLHITG